MSENRDYKIDIQVSSRYVAEQSDPAAGRYLFAYTIRLLNSGTKAAQLISRHWVIIDADGKQEEVRGLGVIGHQPRLAPGESFEYTSSCALATPVGTMQGSYQMTADDGVQFDAPIPRFILAMPRTLH